MGPHAFRIHVAEPKLRDVVSSQLADYVRTTDDLLLGYKVDSPEKANGMYVLLSGAGTVLGRARSGEDIVQILVNHLAGQLIEPAQPGYLRIGLRVLSTSTRTALLGPTLATRPTLIERSMERAGVSVVDSAFVDVDPATGQLNRFVTPADAPVAKNIGAHLSPTTFDNELTELLWPGEYVPADLSISLVTRELARFARNGDRAFRLRASRLLARHLDVRVIASRDSRDVIAALV